MHRQTDESEMGPHLEQGHAHPIFIQLQRKYVHFECLNQVSARGEFSVCSLYDRQALCEDSADI